MMKIWMRDFFEMIPLNLFFFIYFGTTYEMCKIPNILVKMKENIQFGKCFQIIKQNTDFVEKILRKRVGKRKLSHDHDHGPHHHGIKKTKKQTNRKPEGRDMSFGILSQKYWMSVSFYHPNELVPL